MNKSAQILVVDDDPLNRLVLENTLNDDYDIVVCGSCEEAQSVLSKKNVDLILLDILMGNGSGFELLEKCKTCIHSYNIPIIIVSQSHSFQDEAKAARAWRRGLRYKTIQPCNYQSAGKNPSYD
ncbi:response regulator [Pseudoalteromonas xiamenensis]